MQFFTVLLLERDGGRRSDFRMSTTLLLSLVDQLSWHQAVLVFWTIDRERNPLHCSLLALGVTLKCHVAVHQLNSAPENA
jgi:hypothetical protein